jgi:hypothetical protein
MPATSSRPILRTSGTDVSARKTYDLVDEPTGQDYDTLLDCALVQCATAVLTAHGDAPGAEARAALDALEPHLQDRSEVAGGTIQRYTLNADTVVILKATTRGLYGWRHPELPADLCLLRRDGSPWLVSIAAERLGYLELTPFEKLLLGRAAPGLAAVLAHQVARDAILAYFERRLEAHLETLTTEVEQYARSVAGEGRDGLVEALAKWLESGEESRVSVALDVAGALRLSELAGEVARLQGAAAQEPAAAPDMYRSNLVLHERWKARRRRQLERVLAQLTSV